MPTNLMLIASGSGTDANAIMEAWVKKQIPEIDYIVLASTRPGAGCLEKATNHEVKSFVLKPPSSPLLRADHRLLYQGDLEATASFHFIKLVFLVGCVVILPPIGKIPMYNIHPADPVRHGGEGMYGLRVHEHVLAEVIDLVERGKKNLVDDRFFTYPTVHEVTEKPDDGPPLLRASVEIPKEILRGILVGAYTMSEAAGLLQKAVLPYEWQMLPAAVRMAAARLAG